MPRVYTPLVADSDGAVRRPFSFHDAEIVSFVQTRENAKIIFDVFDRNGCAVPVLVRCDKLEFIHYQIGWFQNVILSLNLFHNIDDWASPQDLETSHLCCRDQAFNILKKFHPQRQKPFTGLVLFAEPCAENELLIQCGSVSFEILK